MVNMKFMSYGVMIYMLLALIWWTVLLHRNSHTIHQKNIKLHEYSVKAGDHFMDDARFAIEEKHFLRNRSMIIGEGIVFGLSLILGIWFIQKAYNNEVIHNRNQKNFLLSITHELKSPITSINLIAETLIKRQMSDEKRQELSSNILSESNRLEKLINNVLMATKLDSGYRFNSEAIELEGIIQQCIDRKKLHHLDLTTQLISQGHSIVKGDREALVSVFNNLIENSIKYAGRAPKINIKIEKSGSWMKIMFSDNGPGIPDGEKVHVFKQFYRMGNEETRQTKGTGLGLYIVDKIIRAHRGMIKVSDHPDGGSIFTIIFPI